MTESYLIGQRWASVTEPELGLGVVEALEGRRVEVAFPAVDELRVYAMEEAPLARVRYHEGERLRTEDGRTLTVLETHEADGLLRYVARDEVGAEHDVHESDLDSRTRFGRPLQRLLAGRVDPAQAFRLRMETLQHRHRHRASPAFGLYGARVALLPHQLYVATEICARPRPRVLLADEVGLGKTIEAGLVIHRLLATGRAERVLILVPESLVHQWLVEMLRRFNLTFTILDRERCEAIEASDDANPFEAAQLVIAPIETLVEAPERAAAAVHAGFDVLVVDEAHHLRWDPSGEADTAYRCVEALAEAAASVLLLTATPEQLGTDGHFARLRLLDPGRFHDLETFRREEAGYQEIGELVEALDAPDAPAHLAADPRLRDALTERLGSEAVAAVIADAGTEDGTAVREAIDALLDRHGTGRILYRNTRDNIGGFPDRVLIDHPLDLDADDRGFVAGAPFEAQLQPEAVLGPDWLARDPRCVWLAQWLLEHRGEKTLVICARASTARTLEEHLRTRHGVRTAVFHEGMTLVARDRAAAHFADPEDGAQVLICSEIGSEGRNFQFARDLILFDLPMSPDLLEQRIGRLDRIGQAGVVRIHAPYLCDTAQARLLAWYRDGLDAFARPCAVGQRIVDELGDARAAALSGAAPPAELDALIARTAEVSARLLEGLRSGRDRLLERNSCRPGPAAELVAELSDPAPQGALASYLERALDRLGVEVEHHSAHAVVLRPGAHLMVPSIPGLPEDGLTGTYDRTEALGREDLHFLTWDHPLVNTVMDLLVEAGIGNSSLGTVNLRALAPGTLLLEMSFAVHCPAPRELAVERFLSGSLVRVVTDGRERDLGDTLTADALDRLIQPVKREAAAAVTRRARERIETLIGVAERLAEPVGERMVATAMGLAAADGEREIARIEALAAVNPAIGEHEAEHLRSQVAEVLAHLEATRFELDAMRVVVAT